MLLCKYFSLIVLIFSNNKKVYPNILMILLYIQIKSVYFAVILKLFTNLGFCTQRLQQLLMCTRNNVHYDPVRHNRSINNNCRVNNL